MAPSPETDAFSTQDGEGPTSVPRTQVTTRPLIGAQLKIAGGFALVPQRADELGAEVVQLFNSNARTWKPRRYDPEESDALCRGLAERGMPLFFHTIYLINLAGPDDRLRDMSARALAEALFIGAVTRAAGVVTHVGSHRGEGFPAALPRVKRAVGVARRIAEERLHLLMPDFPLPELLFESSAGSGSTVGRDLAELEALLAACSPFCGLCLDTAHMFAAGRAVHTPDGLEDLVSELEARTLLPYLRLIHLNDSRSELGSKRDRHENLGEGRLGLEALARIVRHRAFREIPFVLEVPGEAGDGPDAVNILRAKSMRETPPAHLPLRPSTRSPV